MAAGLIVLATFGHVEVFAQEPIKSESACDIFSYDVPTLHQLEPKDPINVKQDDRDIEFVRPQHLNDLWQPAKNNLKPPCPPWWDEYYIRM